MANKRRVLKFAAVLAGFYLALTAALLAAMRQPPAVFGKIMAKTPKFMFFVFPFKPLWLFARAGGLKVGDMAPDFALQTGDKKSKVQLSSFRGQKPVVLVFGSYT